MSRDVVPATAPLPSSVDVLVAGSGVAGLVAALVAAQSGARVLLVEAATLIGGTTAISGGRSWVPCNNHALTAGIVDGSDEALGYFLAASPEADRQLARTFVDAARATAAWLEATTAHRFVPCLQYPDYYAELPGGKAGGRALDSVPMDTRRLGPVALRVRDSPSLVPMTHEEWRLWRYAHRFDWDLIDERRRCGIMTGGRALVAALLEAVLAAGVEIAVETRLVELHEGRRGIKGATVDRRGYRDRIEAPACVVATGGFEWNREMRSQFLPEAVDAFGSPPTNRGDAVTLARGVGAAVHRMDEAWWMPMVHVPGETLDGEPFYRSLITERGLPRSILVNVRGRRFIDEALPYNDVVQAIKRCEPNGLTPNTPAWLIFDEGFQQRYSLATIRADRPVPSWVTQATTLPGLAAQIGVEPEGLRRTVAEWNEMSACGRDERFGRGETIYERYYGDPVCERPNLGPIDSPPFYAVEVLAGTIGTKGGPRIDRDGQVLRGDGPVPGLYAAGNAAAGWVGTGYPGPGATISVGMTFAYRAARHATGASGA